MSQLSQAPSCLHHTSSLPPIVISHRSTPSRAISINNAAPFLHLINTCGWINFETMDSNTRSLTWTTKTAMELLSLKFWQKNRRHVAYYKLTRWHFVKNACAGGTPYDMSYLYKKIIFLTCLEIKFSIQYARRKYNIEKISNHFT